jgi:hypothetical protein
VSRQVFSSWRDDDNNVWGRVECDHCDGMGEGDDWDGSCLYCSNGVVVTLLADDDDELEGAM